MRKADCHQEVGKPKVLLAIHQTPSERPRALNAPAAWQKRAGMSDAHLELIRKLPCSVCPAPSRSEPHYLKAGAARGFGLRSTDRWAIPICRFHCSDVGRAGARGEEAWFAKWALDPYALATALWNATNDLPRMSLLLIEHKQLAIRSLRKQAVITALMRHGMTRDAAEDQYDSDQRARRMA